MLWFWLFVAPALALALASLLGERRRAAWLTEQLAETGDYAPPATVIVPVKGADEGLRENLCSLAALDYPDYQLIVAARSAADIPPGVLPPAMKVVLARGENDPHTSEKIQNLAAAVAAARPQSEILAFADSDGEVRPGWLRALAKPLEDERAGAATAYRWYLPDPPDFWSLVRSVWNAPIAGLFGPGDSPFAWGGAMAIRKNAFVETGVREFWKNSVSDDYGLTKAVRKAGLRIAFAPGAMVASRDHTGGAEFFRWALRQMVISRLYGAPLWWKALIGHLLYCAAMAACAVEILAGSGAAEWALLALLSPGLLKAANRATLAKAQFPEHAEWFRRYGWVHTWWTPFTTWIWLGVLVASAFTSTIEWRGYRYRLSRRSIIGR